MGIDSHLDGVFEPYDLSALAASVPLAALEYRPEVDSTNSWALSMARDPARECPFLALAARQTSGRGRGSNQWWSTDGAATFSLVIDPARIGIPPARCQQIALATGVAVAECLSNQFAEGNFQVKWPNDVYLNDRKVCGILVESVAAPGSRTVVGVGINVNNSLIDAPVEIARKATALCDVANAQFGMTEMVTAALDGILTQISSLAQSPATVLGKLRKLCWLRGKLVAVAVGSSEIYGRCLGIDDQGALLLATAQDATTAIMAGVVLSAELDS